MIWYNRGMKGTIPMKLKGLIECKVSRVQYEICHWENGAERVDREIDELRQKIAEYQGTKEYNSSAIFAKILKRRGYASGFTATFPFEGNTGRILDRGDATTKDINYSLM